MAKARNSCRGTILPIFSTHCVVVTELVQKQKACYNGLMADTEGTGYFCNSMLGAERVGGIV